ncbi:hypothetical protein GGH96_003168 [Coemansia sp. RSA 1972]|nr:hypothetical protein GGH96_003168 [Coemansia sp. RSA 1972]
MAGDEVTQTGQMKRPTFIAIHARDAKATILFISSGIRQCMGYRPEELISKSGSNFIADTSNEDYPKVYADKQANADALPEDNDDDDDASAYVMYVNGTTPSGVPVFHKITSFKGDNCILCIGMAFPEVPFLDRRELEVKMLDKSMQSLNITRELEQIERRRNEVNKQGGQGSMFCARSKRVKAMLVLELPEITEIEVEENGRRPNGPLVAFCTASIAQIVDADNSDIMNQAFLKLVAPEDILNVSSYFDQMSESDDVLFETFSLLQRPHVIEGDIFVSDEENRRVVVECMGAAVNDGVAILMRKLRVQPAPKKDKLGNYIRPVQDSSSDKDELSLLDLLSTEPETTDVQDCWSQLR